MPKVSGRLILSIVELWLVQRTGVAQLAERWFPKPEVAGSIPSARAAWFAGKCRLAVV